MHIKIDTDWLFHKGEAIDAEKPDCDDSSWQTVRIPHDWSIDGPFSKDNYIPEQKVANHLEGRADSYLPKGTGWYRKKLDIDKNSENSTTYIEFEGVFRNSTLWVNGKKVGIHPWGYTGFFYDITNFLSPAGKPDILAMYVDARKTEGWWYEGSGIYRHVWVIMKDRIHIPPWGVFVSTPDVSGNTAKVRISTAVTNHSSRKEPCRVVTEITAPDSKTSASITTDVIAEQGKTTEVLQECMLDKPVLWSVRTPNLYTVRTSILIGDKEVDRIETPLGIRWFEFTADRGFFLNGEHLQLRGGCIHHDFGGLGCALPDRANEKTVEMLKAMGCNMVRSAHNAAAPSLMDACDRLGLLFWAENRYYLEPVDKCSQPLRELVRRDRNHPCIVIWSLANTAGSPDGELTGYLKGLNAVVKEEDASRPTGVALEGNDGANANGFSLVTDVVGYNGGGMGIDDRDHKLFPKRKMLITEYSSACGTRGVYENRPVEATGTAMKKIIEEFGDGRVMQRAGKYQTIFRLCEGHEKEWNHIALRPWLAGGIMWSAIEYFGETSGWPFVTSQFGVMDVCRFPKDTFYYYKKLWTSEPVLHIFPHWTWPGREGQPIDIWCYTNCDDVKLYLNGQFQKGIPDFLQQGSSFPHLYWTVPYEPGELVAEGKINGKIVCRQKLRTAKKPAKLTVGADRPEIRADNEDLSFMTVRIEDEAGTPVPFADNLIQVRLTGEGRLLGMCSGDPCSHQLPKSGEMYAFNGLCLAIVQSTETPGVIQVKFSSPELTSTTAEIKTL